MSQNAIESEKGTGASGAGSQTAAAAQLQAKLPNCAMELTTQHGRSVALCFQMNHINLMRTTLVVFVFVFVLMQGRAIDFSKSFRQRCRTMKREQLRSQLLSWTDVTCARAQLKWTH
jgi:hypothetical protein